MNRKAFLLAATALFTVGAVSAAVAAQNAPSSPPGPKPPAALAPPLYGPYTQAQGWFGNSGAPEEVKNISAISSPQTGVYCITVSGYYATYKSAPIVTVEWGTSLGVALFALWDESKFYCTGTAANVFEVQTYKADTGGVGSPLQTPVLSSEVGFVFTLP